MEIGIVGLGRMGGGLSRRLMEGGHRCVVWDRSAEAVTQLTERGATGAPSLQELVRRLRPPRAIWVMLPAGEATETTIAELSKLADRDDVVIDGGNSRYTDDLRRSTQLAARGIHYLDVGTSGGVWGEERGFCLMIGGEEAVARRLGPIFQTLAPGADASGRRGASTAEEGYLYCGPAGAGHFVKMVHNGIEYGLMQAFAEGFDILRNASSENVPAERRYRLDLAQIAEVWRHGSVITSWLLDLSASALARSPELAEYSGYVEDSGEGRWTMIAALEERVPANVLSASIYSRFRSRMDHNFADKMLSAMRAGFGGHREPGTRGAGG